MATMNPHTQIIAVLDAVRDVLSNPDRWTAGKMARDERGESADPVSDKAVCWCLLGAVVRVTSDLGARSLVECELNKTAAPLLEDCGEDTMLPPAAVYNDEPTTSHGALLKLIDDTIARLRG